MTKAPTLKLKITQYESSITYQEMLDRKFKVNQAQYRTKDKYSWLIENVEATEVEVLLSGGETTAALVTYSLAYRPTSWGWRERRALVDTQYIDDDGKIKPFEAKFGKSRFGFITKDGKKRADADGGQNWPPDYEDYEIYSVTDFSGFLQV